MFTREESKEIRKQFWIFFGKRYPRKWLLYNTGVKDLNLKFDFDNDKAIVSIDSESRDEIDRIYYFDKILSLKNLLLDEVSQNITFESEYILESGKLISRAYIQLEGVNINNKNHWPQVFDFMFENMSKLELFYIEYQDFIKS
ncbi:DUF4268 domain-containing protein [Dokdonia sp. Dokd-P16]|uniref:DUF4268 domain-containing protein n=1 Tax=Dokdonia sp. Dokd-P16 TaxID=2173169 RepID=UPI000D54635D|nr:DUF4268 domain-containing protein [Dokdonia sp. Dokd-P16]AWH72821.1 DUF4268 domain-containing protein [Dokdonia sp. Dokd-P16]